MSKWAVKGNISKFKYKISVYVHNLKAKKKSSKDATSEEKEK